MPTYRDECQFCFEEVLFVEYDTKESGVCARARVALQLDEVEITDDAGARHRGHERHWKYCPARPTTGSASAEPPEEPPDEPDKVLNE